LTDVSADAVKDLVTLAPQPAPRRSSALDEVGARVAEEIVRERVAHGAHDVQPPSLQTRIRVMKAMKLVPALVPALGLLIPALAYAQPESSDSAGFDHEVAPVRNAFEIGVATGYAQGGGKLGGNAGSLEDVAGPGGTVEIDLGYRIIPQLSVGAYGTFATFQKGDSVVGDTNVLGATAGVQAAWHFRPDRSVDPWVSLGSGWRGLWLDQDNTKTTSLQGLELARLQIGADYRVSKDIAIAPVVGGSLSMFVSQDTPMTTDYDEIQGKKVNFTGFAGLSGRFDLGGSRR
jgi:hypothetical protein